MTSFLNTAPTCACGTNVDSCGTGPGYGSHAGSCWFALIPGPVRPAAVRRTAIGSSFPPKPSSASSVQSFQS